ncbi:hypothetical protein ABZ319_12335 [Nocardia sp. NPDC005978]|uniref:hypothetical protein n=1 Tax=Nocardia sp. NPDC005978 TaxID=3156725 RepID=UPI0033B130AF
MTITPYETGSPPSWVGRRSAAWNLMTASGIAQFGAEDSSVGDGRVYNYSVRDGAAAVQEYARTRNIQDLLLGSPGNQVKTIGDPMDSLVTPGPSPGDIGPPKSLTELAVPGSKDEPAKTAPKTEIPPLLSAMTGTPGTDGKTTDLPDVRPDILPELPPTPSTQPQVVPIVPLPEGTTPEMAVFLGLANTPEPTPQPLDLLDVIDIGARGLPEPGTARTLPSGLTPATNLEGTATIWTFPSGDSFTTAPPSIKRIVQQSDLQQYNPNAVGILNVEPYRPSSYRGIGPDGPVDIQMPAYLPEPPALLNDPTPAEIVRIQRPDGTFGFGVVNAAGQLLYESDAIGRQVVPPEPDKRWWESVVSFGAGIANPVVESVKDLGAKVGIGGPGVKNAWLGTFNGMGSLVGLGPAGGPGVWDSWKALGKDTLAWDDWARGDFAYAAGKLTFNIGSLFLSGGSSAALKLGKLGPDLPKVKADTPDRKAIPDLPIRAGEKPKVVAPDAPGGRPQQPKNNPPELKGDSTQPAGNAESPSNPATPNPSTEPSFDPPGNTRDPLAPGSSISPKPNALSGIGDMLQQPGTRNGLAGRLNYDKNSNGLTQNPFRQDPLVGASVPRRTPDKVDRDAATTDRSVTGEPIRPGSTRDGKPAGNPESNNARAETGAVIKVEYRGASRSEKREGEQKGEGNRSTAQGRKQVNSNTSGSKNEEEFKEAPVKLNLGAGENRMDGAVNTDLEPRPGLDVRANAETLPFRDAAFDEVHSVNPYKFNPVNSESARVLKPNGTLVVTGSPKNKYIKPPAELEAMGFRLEWEGPMVPEHAFGTQRLSNGRPLDTTENHVTRIYRRI